MSASQNVESKNVESKNVESQNTEKKLSEMYYKIQELLGGFCINLNIQQYHRNTKSSYEQIKELLQYKTDDKDTNTLSSNEVEKLCYYYSFITHDVHGFYPDENCIMLRLLRSAKRSD